MSTPTATAEELRASLRASRARVLELEDALRLREELSLVTEKQLEGAWVTLAERDALIASMTGESGRDGGGWAVRRNEVLDRVFEALREAFTCPICFDGFTKSAAVSLQCGRKPISLHARLLGRELMFGRHFLFTVPEGMDDVEPPPPSPDDGRLLCGQV